jgi:hypothetical protein
VPSPQPPQIPSTSQKHSSKPAARPPIPPSAAVMVSLAPCDSFMNERGGPGLRGGLDRGLFRCFLRRRFVGLFMSFLNIFCIAMGGFDLREGGGGGVMELSTMGLSLVTDQGTWGVTPWTVTGIYPVSRHGLFWWRYDFNW